MTYSNHNRSATIRTVCNSLSRISPFRGFCSWYPKAISLFPFVRGFFRFFHCFHAISTKKRSFSSCYLREYQLLFSPFARVFAPYEDRLSAPCEKRSWFFLRGCFSCVSGNEPSKFILSDTAKKAAEVSQ